MLKIIILAATGFTIFRTPSEQNYTGLLISLHNLQKYTIFRDSPQQSCLFCIQTQVTYDDLSLNLAQPDGLTAVWKKVSAIPSKAFSMG